MFGSLTCSLHKPRLAYGNLEIVLFNKMLYEAALTIFMQRIQ